MNIFVTGSSRGLGAAFVNYYLKKNAKVYGLGRSLQNADDYAYESVDISDERALDAALKILFKEVKTLDLIVLNAGVLGRIQDTSACELPRLKHEMDVNMWANKSILDFLLRTRSR